MSKALGKCELHCPRCGRKLSEHVNGSFVFQCPKCKSQVGGETKPVGGSVITAVTGFDPPFKPADFGT
jgi:ribosomal protein L37AE/L43A